MEKGTLQKWGRSMTALSFKVLFTFSGLSTTIYAAVLAVINAPSIREGFPSDPLQIILLLVKGSFIVGVAVFVLGLIYKVVTYLLGILLIKLDDLLFSEKAVKLILKTEHIELGERSEFYINFKNGYFSTIEKANLMLHFQIPVDDGYTTVLKPIRWRGILEEEPLVNIRSMKSKKIHIGTVNGHGSVYIHSGIGSYPIILAKEKDYKFTVTAQAMISKSSKEVTKNFNVKLHCDEDNKVHLSLEKVKDKDIHYFMK